jgi:hypothetical protein
MVAGSRLRQIGWAVVLAICVAGFTALTFKVNTVKSEVALAERAIIGLEREKLVLETEFQARANQQQLADWNRVEYGYLTPAANQYLDNERQLAALGMERGLGAPAPIRVAKAAPEEDDGLLAMVSPVTGQPVDEDEADDNEGENRTDLSATRSLADRLARQNPLGQVTAKVGE